MTTATAGTLPLARINPSTTNPRRNFDRAKLEELTDSIKEHGVLQPILVRPNGAPDYYEIVAGERRYRAARKAGLEEIPATVRELTDAQVLEIQVVENVQRADLLPMEEAEGFERLLQCSHADGRRYTVEELAAKINKSVGYVYQKRKLNDLCPEARKALEDGKIAETTAVAIARIPVHDLQREAVKTIAGGGFSGQPMTHRQAIDYLQRHFMLRLAEAPFDRKAIYTIAPVKDAAPYEAPACGECPKRTGNQPELFPDVKSGDVCTDPKCFAAKRDAATAATVAELKEQGIEVLTGDAARKVMPYPGQAGRGWVRLDAPCYDHPQQLSWEKVLGKDAPRATVVIHPERPEEPRRLVPEKEARKALEAKAPKWLEKIAERKAASSKEDKAAEAKRERTEAVNFAIYVELRSIIRDKGIGADELRAMCQSIWDYMGDVDERVMRLWGATDEDLAGTGFDVGNFIANSPAAELVPILFDLCIDPRPRGGNERVIDLAKKRGVDRKAVEQRVKAELKAQAKAPKEEEQEGAEAS